MAREVDVVRVKGKNRPVKIYELISMGTTHPEMPFFDSYHKALNLFYDKKFKEAEVAFLELLKIKPDDYLCQMYLERTQYSQNNPVPESWDGVFDRRKS